jgi:hypothetical protein
LAVGTARASAPFLAQFLNNNTQRDETYGTEAQAAGVCPLAMVVNCPVIYTPFGGLLSTAKIIGDYKDHGQSR